MRNRYKSLAMAAVQVKNKKGPRQKILWIVRYIKGKCKLSISIILIFTLVACGSPGNEIKMDDITLVKALEPVELHIYSRNYEDAVEPGYAEEVRNMLEQVRNELKDSIKVTPVFHWINSETYETKLVEMINAGERVDAFTNYNLSNSMEKGLILDLTELLPHYAPDYYQELISDDIIKEALDSLSIDGKLYEIPCNWTESPRYCIVARKDLVEKYSPGGFETLEDYGLFLEQVKKNEQGVLPGMVNGYDYFQAYVHGNGYYTNSTTYFFSEFDDSKMSALPIERLSKSAIAYDILKEWKAREYVARDNRYVKSYSYSNGKLASQLFDMRNTHNSIRYISPNYTYSVYPLYMKSMHMVSTPTTGVSICKTCRTPERVLMFIEWLHSSQHAYDLFMYGVKDRNYSLQGEKLNFPTSMNLDKKKLADRWESDFFKDHRYERTYPYEPDDYKELYRKVCSENVITGKQLFEKFKYDEKALQKDEQRMKWIQKEYEKLQTVYDKYYENMWEFLERIDENYFDKTPAMLIEEQKEIGVDTIIEFNKKVMDWYVK